MRARKLLIIVCGFFALAAPTPGAVGSCGSDELDRPADFMSYCQKREELSCTRRFLRQEITAEARDICRWDAVDACGLRSFPSDCRPTRRETEACLRALASFDTLDVAEADLKECKTDALCKATPSDEAEASARDAGESP